MYKRTIFNVIGLMIIALTSYQNGLAFSPSNYAATSKLSSGHWVKITVPEDGIYQITAAELADMGFNDINSVRLYGCGGHMISEVLDGSAMDDLSSVPSSIINGKLCFYGLGAVSYELLNPRNPATRHFTRVMNTYSTAGCYFLTDIGDENSVAQSISGSNVSRHRDVSINRFHHEKELVSMSLTGKDLLGESMQNGVVTIDYSMPGLVERDTILVKAAAAGTLQNSSGYINATLNGTDRLPFMASDAIIYTPSTEEVYYNTKAPVAMIVPTVHNENGTITVSINTTSGVIKEAKLDYVLLTYRQKNDMTYAKDGQLRLTLAELKRTDAIDLANADENIHIWDVTNASDPRSIDVSNDGAIYYFAPGYDNAASHFIAFNPGQDLKSITSWEEVENQNIHGEETPDMVIITNKNLLEQAERLAELHRNHDNMDVLVVTQEQVFNEFSSGTPDAMAYRLMCKMFYDRNNQKFKNLLLLGGGSYDNRNLLANRPYNILTYQTDLSYDEEYSFVSDDFFGLMDDRSGYSVSSSMMRIGVGRITSTSVDEAQTDIDKIENYVLHPDYGPWRNSNLYTADADDQNEGLHSFQAEGICNLVTDNLNTGMAAAKVYVSQYPRAKVPGVSAERQTATDGNTAIINSLNEGQYFMTYVGHAGSTNFSKYAHLWTSIDAANITNRHLPIMTTACCNVARYDSDKRGIAEIMFHNPKGGVIAMLTSTRAVYANYNDDLNRAWCNAMFSYEKNGYMPTLGEVVMKAKQSFGTSSNFNKMSFLLLGDPAIKVNYPKPYFKITSINDAEPTESVNISPLQQVVVKATVMNPDNVTVNTNFNGDGYVTIYGEKRLQTTTTRTITRDIYYPREVLAQVQGRVVNGEFTATVTMPQYYPTNDSTASIKVYAHMDDSDEMVNGRYDKAVLTEYNPNIAVQDNIEPIINAMYFNDAEEFATNPKIIGDATLYINASDDIAFNMQSGIPVGQMKLLLDGGNKSYSSIKDFVQLSNNGKEISIEFPMNDLEVGRHNLTFTVYDAAGNSATRSIDFIIEQAALTATAVVTEHPAVDEATFIVKNQSFTNSANYHIRVYNTIGDIVYSTTTSQMPFKWDLKDNSGNRVEAGVYRFAIAYEVGAQTGATATETLIVVDPVNQNR